MSTMNISLPESLKSFVDEQIEGRRYGTSSEYVRELIRRDQARQQMRALLVEGLSAPVVGVVDAKYWKRKRRALK